MRYFLALLIVFFFSCDKNAHGYNELSDLLQSQTWYISYIQEISESGQLRFDESYPYKQYKINFDNDNIIIQTYIGEYIGTWRTIEEDKIILQIKIPNNSEINKLSGDWTVDDIYVWGYDQDRIVLKKNNIEIGLK